MWSWFAREFRKSAYFKRIVKEAHILEYWHERGFPDQCRPVGDDDFECDEIT
jgi:hypothetical protein